MKLSLLFRLTLVLLLASAPSLFAQTIFKINTLTANNVSSVLADPQIGDDRGGIAVSTSKAFLVGDDDPVNGQPDAGIFNRTDLGGGTFIAQNRDGIVMDIHSQAVYTFANSGTPVPGNSSPGTFTIDSLIQLDPDTGATTGTVITLSTPITITASFGSGSDEAGVFSGYDRIVLVDSTSITGIAYNIDLPSGTVTNIGTLTAPEYSGRSPAENWATYGVAEFFGGHTYLAYVDGVAFPHTKILRTNVSTNLTSLVTDFSPLNMSDGHEFTVVPSLGRWYFHYEGGDANSIAGNAGGGGGETLAFADATFTVAPPCTPPPPNMISWWPGDGNADDIEGGHHGTLLGGVSFAAGEVNQAFSFDGTDGHIEIPDSPSLNPTSQITIDAWVKTSTNSRQALVSKFNQSFSSPEGSYDLAILNDSLLEFRLDNVGYLQVPAAVCDGQWHHLAGTYDGTTIFFYVDGVLAASTSGSGGNITSSTHPLYLGAELRDNADSGFLNGQLDEVEIFNRALTPTEIANIYIAGPLGKCRCTPPPANMIAWWPGEGDATDIQGGHNGTINDATFSAGKVNQAFTFDGTDDSVSIPDSADWNFGTGDFTFDFWALGNGTGRMHALSFEPDPTFATSNLDFDFNDPSGSGVGLFVFWNGGGGNFIQAGNVGSYTDGNWHHYALTRSGSALTLYIDGAVAGTATYSDPINLSGGSNNYIGASTGQVTASRFFWNGEIDEVEIFNRALTDSQVAAIYHAGSAGKCRSCTPAPSGMVSWWPGDGNLTDIQGGHNGTGSGGGPSFAGGEVGQAMDFDGVDDFFTAANVPDPNKAFTFDTWVYWRGSTGSGAQTLVQKLDALFGGGASYLLAIADSGVVVSVIGGNVPGGLTFNTSQTVPVNQWTHIAETDDGSTVTIYINGQVATSVTADRDTSSGLLYFGSIGSQFFLNGEMDEIEIYSRGLSQSEVQAIYDAGSGGKCKPAIPVARQFANISSRASVGTVDNVAIGGFIIHSDPSSVTRNIRGFTITKDILIRGIGPSLPVTGKLADPFLELHDGNGALIASNDDWQDDQGAAIQATGLAPSDPKEAAILATLNADNAYTAILRGVGNTTGIGLVEVYDLQATGDSHLANISTRAFVSTGDDVLIGGVIVDGDTPARVLLRGIGPSLTAFGVSGALQDPVLELHDVNGALVESNDDWGSSSEAAAITATGLAPSDPKESAILFVPAPGNYTAIVSGAGGTTGVGLVECYRLQN